MCFQPSVHRLVPSPREAMNHADGGGEGKGVEGDGRLPLKHSQDLQIHRRRHLSRRRLLLLLLLHRSRRR